tara:strand:- start:300 stop:785 length:486 start_codon:yes stop_codon:yes gene_type:complete
MKKLLVERFQELAGIKPLYSMEEAPAANLEIKSAAKQIYLFLKSQKFPTGHVGLPGKGEKEVKVELRVVPDIENPISREPDKASIGDKVSSFTMSPNVLIFHDAKAEKLKINLFSGGEQFSENVYNKVKNKFPNLEFTELEGSMEPTDFSFSILPSFTSSE